jgi:galactokinase
MDPVKQSHVEEYGTTPEIVASAPGRVNLIGEHTDYNDGFVFPMAIDFTVRVAITRRKDSHLRFFSVDYKDRKRATLPTLRYRKEDRWANYPKGIIAEFMARGHALGGMDVTIHGDIPQGAGLSSSAALEVATALAIQDLYGIDIGREELAKLARKAENEFVGVSNGVMDQFISRLAKEGHAMLLDTRYLTYHFVPLPLKGVKILITNSKVPHGLAESEYARRREECRRCVEVLSAKRPGTALRDYSAADVRESMGVIPEATRKKCLHVVEENQRVLEAEEALRKKDLVGFGKLMNRSHESLRDLYEVSCPELDWLVKRATETEGVYGSRLTGAGFGGCTVTLIEEEAIPRYREHILQYERIFGFRPEVYVCKPSAGARIVENRVQRP